MLRELPVLPLFSAPADPTQLTRRRRSSRHMTTESFWSGPTIVCTASRASTRSFSVLWKSKAVQTNEKMTPALPSESRNFLPFRSTSNDAADGEQEIHQSEDHIAPMRLHVGKPALQKNVGVVADDGIDACGLVAGQDHASENERDHVLTAQQRFFDMSRPWTLGSFRQRRFLPFRAVRIAPAPCSENATALSTRLPFARAGTAIGATPPPENCQ